MRRMLTFAAAMLLAACGGPDATPGPQATPTPTAPAEQRIADEGRAHVEEGTFITFNHYPPSSGDHYGRLLSWQAYEQDVPEGYWIHNLEHGGVVLLYNCSTPCPDTVSILNGLYNDLKKSKYGHVKLVVVPNNRIRSHITVVAWNWQLDLATPDAKAIEAFYEAHVDKGPEDVP